ncbi:MAG TPA: hypothetical protein VFD32_12685 [Dehalococcoidia bacterium]|nr:hypothetical protein [Dehalococcoidia bacterium]
MNALAPRRSLSRPRLPALLAALALLVVAGFAIHSPRPALAWLASGTFYSNGSGTGTGGATTISSPQPSVSISITGARPNSGYAVFSCMALLGGDFSCAGRDLPPALQQIQVAPKALSPVVLTLVQQNTLNTDNFGNGSLTFSPGVALLPDVPHSIYNAVQLVNTADPTDSYTALDLQPPTRPVAGVNTVLPTVVTTAIGVPVYVLAQFPGYAYPVAITTLNGAPFAPSIFVPITVFGGAPFTTTIGLCPSTGQPPVAQPAPNGQIIFLC